MKKALYKNVPLASCIDGMVLWGYRSGIIGVPFNEFNDLNHCVLIVGYGSENGTDYWIIKNSMGINFGIDGYAKIKRGIAASGISYNVS